MTDKSKAKKVFNKISRKLTRSEFNKELNKQEGLTLTRRSDVRKKLSRMTDSTLRSFISMYDKNISNTPDGFKKKRKLKYMKMLKEEAALRK